MSEALKPCPFCGWNPVVRSRNAKGVASGKHFFVRCGVCHTEGPRSTTSESMAVERWNERATPAVNYAAAHAVVSAEGGYRNELLPQMFAAAHGSPTSPKRYALSPDNGLMYESERGPWVRYVDIDGAKSVSDGVREAGVQQ